MRNQLALLKEFLEVGLCSDVFVANVIAEFTFALKILTRITISNNKQIDLKLTRSLLPNFKYLGSSRTCRLTFFHIDVKSKLVISSSISRNLSRFFFVSEPMWSWNKRSFSSRSKFSTNSQRWSFFNCFFTSFHDRSELRTKSAKSAVKCRTASSRLWCWRSLSRSRKFSANVRWTSLSRSLMLASARAVIRNILAFD